MQRERIRVRSTATAVATAVVVAAGSGQRLGLGVAKGLVRLGGEPLVVHAVRAAESAELVDEVVVVAGAAQCAEVEDVLADAGLTVHAVVAGGETRRVSVGRGLAAVSSGTGLIAVHDAARPLASPALIDRTVSALGPPWDAVAPGLPLVDTLKLVDPDGRVVRTVDRRALWTVQTPQVFARATLERVHARMDTATVTDDLGLVEVAGGRVRVVEGERRAFKITYPEDLALAEALLLAGAAP